MATIQTGRFVLAESADTVVGRQVNAGPETRAALDQWAADKQLSSGGGGGGGTVAATPGTIIGVKPNTDGTWPTITRPEGAIIWWLRALTPDTNAPLPKATNGYVAGDMIDPPADPTKGEFLPYTGVVFSDSFTNTGSSDVGIKGRTADNYNGGRETVIWDYAAASDAVSYVKANVVTGDYTDIAGSGYIWPATPIPVNAKRRISFNLNASNASHAGIICLRGVNLGQNQVGLTFSCSDTGAITWRIRSRYPNTLFPEVTLGTVTQPNWSKVIIDQDGDRISIWHGATNLTGTIPTAGMQQPPLFGIGATQYGTVHLNNLSYELM